MPRKDPTDVFALYDMSGGPDACWPWQGSWGANHTRPYFMASRRRIYAYRWVFELVNGVELTPDQLICHSCDQGEYPVGCGNPAHLRIGTNQDNKNDAVERERVGLPAYAVRGIRTLLNQGKTQQEIADLYGVSRERIRDIAIGHTYKEVE